MSDQPQPKRPTTRELSGTMPDVSGYARCTRCGGSGLEEDAPPVPAVPPGGENEKENREAFVLPEMSQAGERHVSDSLHLHDAVAGGEADPWKELKAQHLEDVMAAEDENLGCTITPSIPFCCQWHGRKGADMCPECRSFQLQIERSLVRCIDAALDQTHQQHAEHLAAKDREIAQLKQAHADEHDLVELQRASVSAAGKRASAAEASEAALRAELDQARQQVASLSEQLSGKGATLAQKVDAFFEGAQRLDRLSRGEGSRTPETPTEETRS